MARRDRKATYLDRLIDELRDVAARLDAILEESSIRHFNWNDPSSTVVVIGSADYGWWKDTPTIVNRRMELLRSLSDIEAQVRGILPNATPVVVERLNESSLLASERTSLERERMRNPYRIGAVGALVFRSSGECGYRMSRGNVRRRQLRYTQWLGCRGGQRHAGRPAEWCRLPPRRRYKRGIIGRVFQRRANMAAESELPSERSAGRVSCGG